MGRPMVKRLVEAGHQVRAVGRTAANRHDIEELGASAVAGMAGAAEQADVVVICVFNDEQVRQVCLDPAFSSVLRPGSALVVHTTASPATIDAIAAGAPEVEVLDAPVSGGPHDAATGRLTLYVGGTHDTVTRLLPVLACYGDPVLHVGPRGAGQKVKLVNNALFAGHIGLLAESVRLAERLGVPEPTLLEALSHGSAASRVLSIVARTGSVASFIEARGEFVGKDIAAIRNTVGDLGGLDEAINAMRIAGKV